MELFFGIAPPPQLKFKVKSASIEFTITLDQKFMKKSFYDAVVVPFVTMYNKRATVPFEAENIVQVHIDGVNKSGSLGQFNHNISAEGSLSCARKELRVTAHRTTAIAMSGACEEPIGIRR